MFTYVLVCICLEESVRSHVASVTDGYEMPNMGAASELRSSG